MLAAITSYHCTDHAFRWTWNLLEVKKRITLWRETITIHNQFSRPSAFSHLSLRRTFLFDVNNICRGLGYTIVPNHSSLQTILSNCAVINIWPSDLYVVYALLSFVFLCLKILILSSIKLKKLIPFCNFCQGSFKFLHFLLL